MTLPLESVWDYPRPPRLEPVSHRLTVEMDGVRIADTTAGFRILETSHPPTYYIPPGDVDQTFVQPSARRSWCEFKGQAEYWSVAVADHRIPDVAWSYPEPTLRYAAIRGFLSFYARSDLRCAVGGEPVLPQEGDFYGGWITGNLEGPFKGGPGTRFW